MNREQLQRALYARKIGQIVVRAGTRITIYPSPKLMLELPTMLGSMPNGFFKNAMVFKNAITFDPKYGREMLELIDAATAAMLIQKDR